MRILDIAALGESPLRSDPFDHVIVPRFILAESESALDQDYPLIDLPGLFPACDLRYGPAFAALLSELEGPELRTALSRKLGLDLERRPTLVTVRGRCRRRDGKVHTDSTWKVVSALLYVNQAWHDDGGRLRLLRSGDVEDTAVELPPDNGMFLAFRRSDGSFHGHRPFEGRRRVVQINWCTDQKEIDREIARHRRTAWLKRMLSRVHFRAR